jgi:hypothetical protein
VRSQFGDTGAALSLCAAGATAIAVRSARLRPARLRREPTTAVAAATKPTATGFARTGTERRDAVGLWCSKPMVKSSA